MYVHQAMRTRLVPVRQVFTQFQGVFVRSEKGITVKTLLLGQIGLCNQCRPRSSCNTPRLIRVYTVCYAYSNIWDTSRSSRINYFKLCRPRWLSWMRRPTGDQEVAGNPRRGRQHSFVEIDHEIFSTVILSLPLNQEGQLSVSGERMCTILVNRLED